MAAQWMPVDAFLAAVDRTGEPPVPDYQRDDVPPLTEGRAARPGLTGAEYQAAADLAREVGVREAARQYGVSHAALLQAWRRRNLTVVGPGRWGTRS
jgi:hypothetical protein